MWNRGTLISMNFWNSKEIPVNNNLQYLSLCEFFFTSLCKIVFFFVYVIGDEQLRAKEMFYALWVPDLFMQRVYDDDVWSLMCPHECPGLIDSWGDEFKNLYTR